MEGGRELGGRRDGEGSGSFWGISCREIICERTEIRGVWGGASLGHARDLGQREEVPGSLW